MLSRRAFQYLFIHQCLDAREGDVRGWTPLPIQQVMQVVLNLLA